MSTPLAPRSGAAEARPKTVTARAFLTLEAQRDSSGHVSGARVANVTQARPSGRAGSGTVVAQIDVEIDVAAFEPFIVEPITVRIPGR